MPNTMYVEESIIINKDVHEVFEFVKYLKNQDKFSVWNQMDPNQKVTENGTDGTVGYTYSWDSNKRNVGAGSQEITDIIEDQEIHYNLYFMRPMKSEAKSVMKTDKKHEGQTIVTWNFEGPIKFPMSLFKGAFQRKLAKQMKQSLENLKVLQEQ